MTTVITNPRAITLALRRDEIAEVWRIDATRGGERRSLCCRTLASADPLYRATQAAIEHELRVDIGGAYWLSREAAEEAMAAAQLALDSPEDTESNSDQIACPWCGAEHRGLWDYRWERGHTSVEVDCDCGQTFALTRHVSVSYTAKPMMRGATT